MTATEAQTAELAALLRPHLDPTQPITDDAVRAAWAAHEDAFWDRMGRMQYDPGFRAYVLHRLAGTYDAIRAEAGMTPDSPPAWKESA